MPLWQHDPELAQQPSNLIGLRVTRFHHSRTCAMQRQHRLLLYGLDRHETHVRPRHRLTNRLSIVAIVLVALHVRLDELRRHELDLVAQLDELARPVVRTGTGFHANQAGCQIGEEAKHLGSLELLAQHCPASVIDSVNLKYGLCQIDSYGRNLHDGRPLSVKW